MTEQQERGIVKPFCAPVLLSETFRQYYILGLVVIQYVLPLLIISVAYAEMARKLWGSNAPGNKEESRDENNLKNKKKVSKSCIFFVVSVNENNEIQSRRQIHYFGDVEWTDGGDLEVKSLI